MRTPVYAASLAAILLALTGVSQAGEPTLSDIQQTWELTDSKVCDQLSGKWADAAKVRRKIKIISGNEFVWIDYERETGKVLGMAGGSFELKAGQYRESIKYASDELKAMVGHTFVFSVKVSEGKLLQSGEMGEAMKLEEVWVKAPAPTEPNVLAAKAPPQEVSAH